MVGIVSRKIKKHGQEISFIPVMSLFLILVPMLLLTAEFERAAVIDLFLPSSDLKPSEQNVNGPTLNLTIALTPLDITVIANKKKVTLKAEGNGEERKFNLRKLSEELYRIKKQFPKSAEVVILIDGNVRYDTIVDVMDSAREIRLGDGSITTLFPNVALADRVAIPGKKDVEK